MCVGEECAAEVSHPVGAEAELDAGETERPFWAACAIEDGGADAPAALDDEPRVDGEAALLRLREPGAQRCLTVGSTPLLTELGVSFEVRIHIVVGQEGEERDPGAGDAQREPDTLAEHERADGERALLPKQADGLVAAAHGEEGALFCLDGERAHDVASERSDVIACRGHCSHEKELGSRHPSGALLVAVDEALRAQSAQQAVRRRAGEAGGARQVVQSGAISAAGRDETQEQRCPRDGLSAGNDAILSFHNVDDSSGSAHIATHDFVSEVPEGNAENRHHAGAKEQRVIDKQRQSAADAVADIPDGASLAVGGFGLSGNPIALIEALLAQGTKDLSIVSNNCGVDDWGLGVLLGAQRIRKMTSSYVGENREFERQFLTGELELELTPQGTLAEKLRAGGAGIAAFYTQTGVGTQVAEGGLPRRYNADGSVAVASPAKDVRTFAVGGEVREFVLEEAITTDFALVHAALGDRHGNLIFNKAARNFNPLAAMAGRVCIAQVERLVEPGDLDPDCVHLPGVYVHRIIEVGPDAPKRIERRTVSAEGS